jgi:hypothetical protein
LPGLTRQPIEFDKLPSNIDRYGGQVVIDPVYAAGTGNAVTDLIFSIAKRDVTFFSGTAPISFL